MLYTYYMNVLSLTFALNFTSHIPLRICIKNKTNSCCDKSVPIHAVSNICASTRAIVLLGAMLCHESFPLGQQVFESDTSGLMQ